MNITELLADWDADRPVKTVEMGGMSEGYEMAIQLCGFEWLRVLNDGKPDIKAMSDGERDAWKKLHEPIVDARCRALGLEGYYGMSVAQVGAAMNLASCFYGQGYEPALKSAGKDRHITIIRKPFTPPLETTEE